jgi:HEAT repeat protein
MKFIISLSKGSIRLWIRQCSRSLAFALQRSYTEFLNSYLSKLFVIIVGGLALVGFLTCVVLIRNWPGSIERIITHKSKTPYKDSLARGQKALQERDFIKAQQAFEEAVKLNSASEEAHYGLAEVFREQRMSIQMIRHLSYAVFYERKHGGEKLWNAIDTLKNTGLKEAVLPLAIAMGDYDSAMRLHAAWALGKIVDGEEAVEILSQELMDSNEDGDNVLCNAAVDGLENLATFRCPSVKKILDGTITQQSIDAVCAWKRVAESPKERIAEALSQALQKLRDSEIRKRATEALGATKSPAAIEPLVEALKDSDRNVQSAAIRSIGKLGYKKAIEQLAECARETTDSEIRYEVSRTIVMLPTSSENEEMLKEERTTSIPLLIYLIDALKEEANRIGKEWTTTSSKKQTQNTSK